MSLRSKTITGLALLAVATTLSLAQAAGPVKRLPNAQNLGPENSSKTMTVTLWLNQRNKAALDTLAKQIYTKGSPNYHKFLTPDQIKTNFSATDADISQVKSFLKSNNLTLKSVDKWNLFVQAEGSVADIQRAMNVQINRFNMNGATVAASTTTPTIKGAVAPLISHIGGLEGLGYQSHTLRPIDPSTGKATPPTPLAKKNTSGPPPSNLCLHGAQTVNFDTGGGYPTATYSGTRYATDATFTCPGYTPQQIQYAYQMSNLYNLGLDGTGQTIVIVDAYGSNTIVDDANLFSSYYGLPALTSSNFAIYNPNGPVTCGTDCLNGNWNIETTLDVEWAHSVAPGANIILVATGDNSFTNLDIGVLGSIEQGLGPVISNSYGTAEELLILYFPSELIVQDTLNELGAVLGMSVNFSSGDDGDFTYAYGFQSASAPASSPWATGVGGVSLFTRTNGMPQYQFGWGNNETRIALAYPNPPVVPPLSLGFVYGAGGGPSQFFTKPSYQNALPGNVRQTPDIGWVADPYTGVNVIITPDSVPGDPQYIEVIGGTSLACPMFSALWSIANQSLQEFLPGYWLGQAAPYFYGLPADALTDIKPVGSASNAHGTIWTSPTDSTTETAAALAAPLTGNNTFFSTLYHGSSTRWYVLSFETDTHLKTATGWDNVTGVGVPNPLNFVEDVINEALAP